MATKLARSAIQSQLEYIEELNPAPVGRRWTVTEGNSFEGIPWKLSCQPEFSSPRGCTVITATTREALMDQLDAYINGLMDMTILFEGRIPRRRQ